MSLRNVLGLFVDFFERHGFLNIDDRPTWRTVSGGSREYARRLIAPFLERRGLDGVK